MPAFVLGVVLFAGFIWIAGGPLLNAFTDLARGVSFWVVSQLIVLFLLPMIVLAFPMAMLISVILSFNRLSAESEAVAMFASGISFYRLLAPTAGFALVVTLIGLMVNNSVVPAANRRISYIKTNITHEISSNIESGLLPPMRFPNKNIQTLVWDDGGYDPAKKAMSNVTIVEFDPVSERPILTIWAASARWMGGSVWQLRDGQVTHPNGISFQFPTLATTEIAQKPEDIDFLDQDPDNLSFSELARQIGVLKSTYGAKNSKVLDAEVNMWEKIALPCACFVFALVGAPLALNPQRTASRGAASAYGVLIILAYYAMFKFLDIAGANGHIDPMLAAFLPNLVGLGLAAYLVSKVTT